MTLVERDEDLMAQRKAMYEYKEYVEADEQGSQMSEELKSLVGKMREASYNVENNVKKRKTRVFLTCQKT